MIGMLHLVKNTVSEYFEVDANFEAAKSNHTAIDPSIINQDMEVEEDSCLCGNCGSFGTKKCSRHRTPRSTLEGWPQVEMQGVQIKFFTNSKIKLGFKPSVSNSKPIKKPGKVLFPYKEFIKLFNSDKPGFSPCGLLNCGNSCFANVVLQCLTYTRPFIAYLLNKRHQTECRPSQSTLPFSPINILSRLPNIGGNLGYGRQEDAHEFMRFAIDTMQSVCLDEFGEEKAVEPASQETTIIQHIFGVASNLR
uniref:USP domain-containing protein n=1 Tax=Salix viminalis TaxID=40686 RepID=A0A6N2KHM0_SALVM